MVGSDGHRKFFKIEPPRLAKITRNSEMFHTFIKQEFVGIEKHICNVIKI